MRITMKNPIEFPLNSDPKVRCPGQEPWVAAMGEVSRVLMTELLRLIIIITYPQVLWALLAGTWINMIQTRYKHDFLTWYKHYLPNGIVDPQYTLFLLSMSMSNTDLCGTFMCYQSCTLCQSWAWNRQIWQEVGRAGLWIHHVVPLRKMIAMKRYSIFRRSF